MSDQTTNWYLKLTDLVTSPLKNIMSAATASQAKLNDVANTTKRIGQQAVVTGKDFGNSLSQLNARLETLKDLQSKAFSIKHMQNYQRAIDKTHSEINKIKTAMIPPAGGTWLQRMKGDLMSAADQVPGLTGALGMIKNPIMIAAAGAMALTTQLKKSVDLTLEFDKGMAKINATAQLGSKQVGVLKDRLKEIGSESGGNFERIPDAYEKIISQTGKVNLSLDILETAVKGAKAGFTDIDVVAGALAQTLSVVGEQNTNASEVMDTLLKAKALGAGEFGDFAQYLPQLIAAGRNLGVTFKDTAGLFSFMTAKGQSAADSAMLMQNAFTALQKDDIITGLAGKGINLFNKDGMRRNVKEVFLELGDKLKSLTDKQKTQFLIDIGLKDAQARNAFSILTADAGKFKSIMEGVNNAIGETNVQLEATANTSRSWADIGDELKNIGESIGSFLLPVVDTLIQGLKSIGRGIKELFTLKILQRDTWRDEGEDAVAIAANARRDKAMEYARQSTHKQFGTTDKDVWNQTQWAVYQKSYASWLKAFEGGSSKNMIDPNEGKGKSDLQKGKADALMKRNDAFVDFSSMDDGKGKKGHGSRSSGGDGSSGSGKTLIMNLQIHNHFKDGVDNVKRKLTDQIVDAGRDGAVTLGI